MTMIEFMVLNEESLPFRSKDDCESHLPEFFDIVKEAFLERVAPVRVSEQFDAGWYNILLCGDIFLRTWLEKQEKEYRRRLKSLFANTAVPQIPYEDAILRHRYGLSEFYLDGNKKLATPSLGAALIQDAISISFLSGIHWDSPHISIVWMKMDDSMSIEKEKQTVKNAARLVHWRVHLVDIQKQRKENCRKGAEFWNRREQEFPKLVFCGNTEKEFKRMSYSNAMFNRLWDNLKLLNEHILESDSDEELRAKAALDFTDESDSVKNNPKLRRFREFALPGGTQKEFFGLHVKNFPGAFRLHFFPDYQNNKVYIGYFGKHLPL